MRLVNFDSQLMVSPLLGIVATVLYVAAGVLLIIAHGQRATKSVGWRRFGFGFGALAVALHAIVLYPTTITTQGVNLSLFNAGSVVAWCVALVVLMLNVRRELGSLAAVILPAAGAALILDLCFPATHLIATDMPLGMRLHIALGVIAYSLFALAAMQAIFLSIATRQLRQHHPIMHFLPPLPTMEAVMFQLTALAFTLLTVSLALGAAYVMNIRAQHLAHKIVFSVLAWLVFAVLVYGRWWLDWRGRRGVKYVIGGFTLLALAFFGTKFVLELILHRV